MNLVTNTSRSSIPNLLTITRIACIPLIWISLSFEGESFGILAAIFFIIASITDILDGFFARKYSAVTNFGKFLDPLADKLLITVTMLMLIPMNRIPVWVVIIIICREIAITGLRGIAVNEGLVIQASILGKYKTIFQAVALSCLCINYTYFEVDFHVVGMVFLWGALILTIWSGWDYLRQFKDLFI